MLLASAAGLDRALRHRRCRRSVDYVTFMKVERTAYLNIRFDWLFSIYVIFAVGSHHPLSLAVLAGAARPGPATGGPRRGGVRAHEPGRARSRSRSSRSRSLRFLGLPIGHAMIAGSILYLLARRARHGHGRRAAAERHVLQLHHPGRAAVHPRGRADEHRLDDASACCASATPSSGVSAAGWPMSTCSRASSSPACPARPSPTPPRTGKMMQNMMTADGKYRASYAAALTAATAVIGPIIPPSIPMIIYALGVGCLDRLPVPRRRVARACSWPPPR